MILTEELRTEIRDAIFSESENDTAFLKFLDVLRQSNESYDILMAYLFEHVKHLTSIVSSMESDFTKNLVSVATANSIQIKGLRRKEEIAVEVISRVNPHPFVLGERVRIMKRNGPFLTCKGELGQKGEIRIDEIKILNQ